MIHAPVSSTLRAAPPVNPVLVAVLELFIGAGLGDEEIARTLNLDPWSVALLRSVLTAFDAVEASGGLRLGDGA